MSVTILKKVKGSKMTDEAKHRASDLAKCLDQWAAFIGSLETLDTQFKKATWLKRQADLHDKLVAENTKLVFWVKDLMSQMHVNCVYCGHRYGPRDKVPASMADILTEHVEQCPKHPMSKLKVVNDRLVAFAEHAMIAFYECAPGYWDTQNDLEHELAEVLGEDEVEMANRIFAKANTTRCKPLERKKTLALNVRLLAMLEKAWAATEYTAHRTNTPNLLADEILELLKEAKGQKEI